MTGERGGQSLNSVMRSPAPVWYHGAQPANAMPHTGREFRRAARVDWSPCPYWP
jgi:hypothetical protein